MFRISAKFFALLVLSGLAIFATPGTSSAAECAQFPKLSFWGDLSHDSVQQYVEVKFDGDWEAYVERLEYIKKGLAEIHERGKGALIKMKGRKVVLKGEKLRNYLLLSKARLRIVRCLAENNDTADLQNFATAAGGNDAETTSMPLGKTEDKDAFRTYLTLPKGLAAKLRKQAVRRSLIENRKVSVNDIITRTLKNEFGAGQ